MATTVNDVSEMSDAVLKCRTPGLRHQWEEGEPVNIVTNARGDVTMYTQVVFCLRCGAQKRFEKDQANGWRYTRHPATAYADGFLMVKGHGRVTPGEVETERLARMGNTVRRTRAGASEPSTGTVTPIKKSRKRTRPAAAAERKRAHP